MMGNQRHIEYTRFVEGDGTAAHQAEHTKLASHWQSLYEDTFRRQTALVEENEVVPCQGHDVVYDDIMDTQSSACSEAQPNRTYVKAVPQPLKRKALVTVQVRFKRRPFTPVKEQKREIACSTISSQQRVYQPDQIINVQGAQYVPQTHTCQKVLTADMTKCRSCVRKTHGDSCRFQNFRAFPVVYSADQGGGFVLRSDAAESAILYHNRHDGYRPPEFPGHDELNRPMDRETREKLMTTCAEALLPIFDDAGGHAKQANVFRRQRELDMSETCDFCNTGIFASSYLCRMCGQEYCLQCQSNLLLQHDDGVDEKRKNQLFTCTKRAGHPYPLHDYSDLVPVTRFPPEEIEENAERMRALLACGRERSDACYVEGERMYDSDSHTTITDSMPASRSRRSLPDVPNKNITVIDNDALTEEDFLSIWSEGEPLVIDNVQTGIRWTPQRMIEMHGHDECQIVRCDLEADRKPFGKAAGQTTTAHVVEEWQSGTTVGDFFATFAMPMDERRGVLGDGIWKLKDWPPTQSLKTAFPDIYEDFSASVPMPDYTRRDGCKNISSLFAKNANIPDLGPKMYNAWPGRHAMAGDKGTTRLHMDVADAVNILLFASNAKQCNAKQAGAQWDVFRAQDANAIRDFLCEKFGPMDYGDPIHSQIHFLDDELLKELYARKGVFGYRIVQRPGQAVFVPAGCAHQVCNLTDCIKIATDFISPQNVQRCFKLTEEFRMLSGAFRRSWKADMLQLRLQLWYAWSACRAMEDTIPDEVVGEEGQRHY